MRLQQQQASWLGPTRMLLNTVCRVRLREAVGTWWKALEVGVQHQMGLSVVPGESGEVGWSRMLFSSLEGHKTIVDVVRNYKPFAELSKVWSREAHTSESPRRFRRRCQALSLLT